MSEKNLSLFEKIESLIRHGKIQLAKNELALFSKSKKLLPLERVRLALFHMRLGQAFKAIHCINKELAPDQFGSASVEELCEQAVLAHLLNQMGAQNYARRLLRTIEESTAARKITLGATLPDIDRFLGNIYFGAYDYPNALPYYQRALAQVGNPDSYRYKLAQIGVADVLEGMGNTQEAIDMVTDISTRTGDNQKLLMAICLQARGEYYFRRGEADDFQKARKDFDEASILFDEKTDTKDFAFLNKWSGLLRLQEGQEQKAQEELKKSLEILQTSKNRPTTYLEVFYWLEQIASYQAPLADKIALRCHPLPCPFCNLSGKWDERGKVLSNKWIAQLFTKLKEAPEFDCWFIDQNDITQKNYGHFHHKEKSSLKMELVDLVAGLYYSKDGSLYIFSENQTKALLSIVGSGSLGVSQWSLIDSIYDQNFYDPISGIERINKTIEQLRKHGFEISRKDNQYFFENTNEFCLLLPKDLQFKGIIEHLKITSQNFKRKDLEEIYKIKKATANTWIVEWEEKDLIEKSGVGKSSFYSFKK